MTGRSHRFPRIAGAGLLLLVGSFAGGWVGQQASADGDADLRTQQPLSVPTTRHVTAERGSVQAVVVLDATVVAADSGASQSLKQSSLVEAQIRPEQLARFSSLPSTGKAKVDGGPATTDCRLSALITGEGSDILPRIRCTLPQPVAYPGVRAHLALTAGQVHNVVVLPLSAVDGSSKRGMVHLVQGGTSRPQKVELGLRDGVNVEISSGLEAGDTVLDPPPSLFASDDQK
jgi:hypothetical protein